MVERDPFVIRFADGQPLELGRRTCIMGVVNVTPDSFSDGGRYTDPNLALDAVSAMAEAGAEIVDVGGESTRPGAQPVGEAEEADRVLPLIERIKHNDLPLRISVDTTKSGVARQALDAGADMVNDVSALSDPRMLPLLVSHGAPVVLMHMRGTPRTMQHRTDYDDLLASVAGFLEDRAESAVAAGVANDKILVDPGIGFGKSVDGNLLLLKSLAVFKRLGRPILIGASRKSFIGAALDLPVEERSEASLAVAAFASAQGAHVLRVHDVAASVRGVRMIDAIREA